MSASRLHGPFAPAQFDRESWALKHSAIRPRIAEIILGGGAEHVFNPLDALAGYRARFAHVEISDGEPLTARDARQAARDYYRLLPDHGSAALQGYAECIGLGDLDCDPDTQMFLAHHQRLIEFWDSPGA